MKQVISFLLLLSVSLFSFAQQATSPDNFLGYKPGDAFTPHHKIVSYFELLAKENPATMQLQTYGYTYEGKPLLLAVFSSPQNISKLAAIQQQHKSVVTKGGNEDVGIVWLSYNVHGNEPSSSEAAMVTAHALLNPDNKQLKSFLENTVVIIDPCLNPDGRDRYVSWYNSTKGKKPNSDPQSREHSEPWPTGRGNHYYFDLNRDWAWQTQTETQQRMKVYNNWMPHVHVDYHEQYYDNPYYFAPAAEPQHNAVTNNQKEMQRIIGKNNARYFDANGWLYFTRQEFDLFYPSYGDTYPTYNGSIGMTYEQAGHSRAGLSVLTAEKDTLTLSDRIQHHFTTAVSTIEMTSLHNKKLISDFRSYFDDARNAKNSAYKTYLITTNSANKLAELKDLLRKNEIEFGTLTSAKNLKGFNYFSRKTETVVVDSFVIAVSSYQPRSVLASVLLEPQSVLTDSATYDITAWSLPYVYGVKTYGIHEKLSVSVEPPADINGNFPLSTFAYVMPWNSFSSARGMASLLQQSVQLRVSEKAFVSGGKNFDRGSVIVMMAGKQPDNLLTILKNVSDSFQVSFSPVQSGFVESGADFGSADIRLVRRPSVAMVTGKSISSLGAGELWHWFDEQLNYPVSLLELTDLPYLDLSNYDVIVLPQGNYSSLSDRRTDASLNQFLRNGGKVIALENAVFELADYFDIKEKEIPTDNDTAGYVLLKRYENRVKDEVANYVSGAIYNIELDNSHPLAFGYEDNYFSLRTTGKGFSFMRNGWNVGFIKKNNHISGFVGNKLKETISDLALIGEIPKGNGKLIYFTDNPVFRAFWQNGKLMLANAVFMVK